MVYSYCQFDPLMASRQALGEISLYRKSVDSRSLGEGEISPYASRNLSRSHEGVEMTISFERCNRPGSRLDFIAQQRENGERRLFCDRS